MYFLLHFPVPINQEVAVSHHRALSCSDFPLRSRNENEAAARPALLIFNFSPRRPPRTQRLFLFFFSAVSAYSAVKLCYLFGQSEAIIPKRRLFCPFNFGMIFEVFVVGVGVVAAEVDAAAFLAGKGRLGDEEADGEHILELPALGVIELFIHNVSLPEANLFDGLLEVVGFPGDAHISPHQGPKGVFHVGGVEAGAV